MTIREETDKALNTAVRARHPLTPEIARLVNLANYDLYFGPISKPNDGLPWPGFQTACGKISEAVKEVGELWVNVDSADPNNPGGACSDTEPESGFFDEDTGEWEEYYMEGWWHLERRDVLKILLGKELPSYL